MSRLRKILLSVVVISGIAGSTIYYVVTHIPPKPSTRAVILNPHQLRGMSK